MPYNSEHEIDLGLFDLLVEIDGLTDASGIPAPLAELLDRRPIPIAGAF
ncbi:hypothetical protein [Mesorhizobium sp. M0047]